MDKRTIEGLELFKRLIKDGCEWRGDILSKKWSEELYIPQDHMDQVLVTLADFGYDSYKLDVSLNTIWIA